MPTLGHVTSGRVAATIAVAAVATLLTACSNDEVLLDAGARPAPTSERPAYTDQFTVGSATFTTNLPEGARAFELTPAESKDYLGIDRMVIFIVSWPGHDLSTISFADFVKSTIEHPEMLTEGVMWVLQPFDCMGFDTSQKRDDMITSTSPLNGQPLVYARYIDASKPDGGTNIGILGTNSQLQDLSTAFFSIKLGTKPCEAIRAGVYYGRSIPDNPLTGFGYRLFVEGDGTVTTTNP